MAGVYLRCIESPPKKPVSLVVEKPEAAFGYYPLQWHIPWVSLKVGQLLALVCQADERRSSPVSVVEVGESTVIVTAAHAEAVSLWIESDQGQIDEIQAPWWNRWPFF